MASVSSAQHIRIFVLLVVACCVVMALAIASAIRSSGAAEAPASAQAALVDARDDKRPTLVFRNLDRDQPQRYGQIAVSNLPPAGARTLVRLKCDRVYFGGGTGLCLARGSGFAAGYRARIFGPDLRIRGELAVQGVPSRARVSRDGRYGSVTLFVTGHSYADLGGFSTTTTLIDLTKGRKIAELEDFAVTRDGALVTSPDRNFWGVTFARDSDRFYATLSTRGRIYLVDGSIAGRTMKTIHDDVECPSLSPDETRIAYKKRVGPGGKRWRIHILDLKTMRETPLAETRSVDDQVEWLDDSHVLYGISEQIWTMNADGSGAPRRFAFAADSPAVVRW
jgi:hypothetical protein